MSFVAFMLKRPYTVISGLILIALLGVGAVSRMPIDIFPEIDIPVVAWFGPITAWRRRTSRTGF